MPAVLHHALLALAACALADAGLRAGAAAGAGGALRAIAAATVAAGLAVASTLALGAVGLAGEVWAHLLVVAGVALTARRVLPAPAPLALRAGWAALPPRARAIAGAGAGALLLVTAWQVARPWLGPDGVTHHLPIPLEWVASGRAGERVDTVVAYPVGSYPLTFEVAVAWALALSGAMAVASLAMPACVALGAAALWHALGTLRVGDGLRATAVLAVVAVPGGIAYLGQPGTDLWAWGWGCAALALALAAAGPARRRPWLLALALLAAGLSLGAKTTSALPLLAVLGWAAWRVRPGTRAWAAGLAAAAAVAGLWPLRNLADHGSPLWPFVAAPWGDPVPPFMALVDGRFAAAPLTVLREGGDLYLRLAGGGPLLLLGAAVVALVARDRAARAIAAVAVAASLLWTVAPYTGIPGLPGFGSLSVRYLLPAFTAAALAIAVAGARGGARARLAALGVLGAAALTSLDRLVRAFDPPHVPPAGVVAAGAVLGALVLALAARPPGALLPAGVVAATLALALAAPGYVERHARAGALTSAVTGAALAAPGFDRAGVPVAAGPQALAPLAGSLLEHRVEHVDDRTPCGHLRAVARRGVLAIATRTAPAYAEPMLACLRGLAPRFRDERFSLWGGA